MGNYEIETVKFDSNDKYSEKFRKSIGIDEQKAADAAKS